MHLYLEIIADEISDIDARHDIPHTVACKNKEFIFLLKREIHVIHLEGRLLSSFNLTCMTAASEYGQSLDMGNSQINT